MKLLVDEPGSDTVAARAEHAPLLATSVLSYVETYAALARMRQLKRLPRRDHARVAAAFEALWRDLAVIGVDERLVERAARLADRHVLRGYDASHLASALELAEHAPVLFASWDSELNAAAEREQLQVLTP